MIDIHSSTWEAITATLTEQRDKAVKALIADRDSDKQRGKIELIDQILKMPNLPEREPVEQDTYL